jgi:antimicrobial peptide system SdpB family protein
MLTRLGRRVRAAVARPLHTNVVGVARSLIALGTLGTLLFSRASDVFRPAVGLAESPRCVGVTRAGLFCLVGGDHLELGRWLAVLMLVVIASGWRPRWTGLAHWYVAASVFSAGTLVDGGDQAATVLTFLLVPITLTDPRRWHWAPPVALEPATGSAWRALASHALRFWALTALWAIRLQVAGIYFQASVAKMKVAEWRDGTAVYYWFTDPWFGIAEPFRALAMPLLTNSVIVTAITWGAMALEIFLFAGLIATRRSRAVLLVLGIGFHATIAAIHGLPSFALVMWGALILYLRPLDQAFARRG